MTVVLCRHCGRVMTEVPSGWMCECNERIQLTPCVTNSPDDKRKAMRERDARLREFRKKMRQADWDAIQNGLGLK